VGKNQLYVVTHGTYSPKDLQRGGGGLSNVAREIRHLSTHAVLAFRVSCEITLFQYITS
jgi:hypothetical protein